MTQVSWESGGRRFAFDMQGHCRHEVCLGISALANALISYAKNYAENGFGKLTVERYEHGSVVFVIQFSDEQTARCFNAETAALLDGLLLYQANYPEEMNVHLG